MGMPNVKQFVSKEARDERAARALKEQEAYRAQLRAGYEAKANAPRLAEEAAARVTAVADLASMQKGANEEAARRNASRTLLTGGLQEDANDELRAKSKGKASKRKTLIGGV